MALANDHHPCAITKEDLVTYTLTFDQVPSLPNISQYVNIYICNFLCVAMIQSHDCVLL